MFCGLGVVDVGARLIMVGGFIAEARLLRRRIARRPVISRARRRKTRALTRRGFIDDVAVIIRRDGKFVETVEVAALFGDEFFIRVSIRELTPSSRASDTFLSTIKVIRICFSAD